MSLGEELGNMDAERFCATFEAVAEKMDDPYEEQSMLATAEDKFPALTMLPELLAEATAYLSEDQQDGAMIAARLIVASLSEYAIGETMREQFLDCPTVNDEPK